VLRQRKTALIPSESGCLNTKTCYFPVVLATDDEPLDTARNKEDEEQTAAVSAASEEEGNTLIPRPKNAFSNPLLAYRQ